MLLTVRKATWADLDTILDIRLASFQGGEQWQYRYPYYYEYPEDHAISSRHRIEAYLRDETGASSVVMLAEAASEEGTIPVAWSVWGMPNSHNEARLDTGLQVPG